MKNKRARLTEGPISRNIFSLMVPMMMGMVAVVINNLAGAFFIARVSTDQLAAISFTFPVSFIVGSIAMALGVGTSSVVARLFGSGDREEVRRLTLHAMLLAVACGGVMVAIGLATIDPLFRLLGADEVTLPYIHRYMAIYYWGGIFLVAPMIANSVLRASGDAKRPALLMTTAAVLNIVFDAILIFGLFGLPRMEIAGAALGGVLANVVTFFASSWFVIHGEKLVNFAEPHFEKLLDSWRRILHVGIPTLTSSLMAPVTTAFITRQVARFGPEAVAGFGLASRVEALTMLALMALSAAMTPFTGQNFGARRLDRVEQGVNFAYRFSWMYGAGIAVVMWLGARFLVDFFDVEAGARHAALLHMWIVPLSYTFLGMSMTTNGAFNAMGKPMAAMWVSLSRTVMVYAPLAWVLSQFFGLVGIFAAAATANVVAGSIGFTWFRAVFREKAADIRPAGSDSENRSTVSGQARP
jgi:putative MATE family efflux protein